MERLLQYWDDIDDLIGACALLAERLRRLAIFALATLLFSSFFGVSLFLAFKEPPLGLAIVTMLAVIMMFYSVTAPARVVARN